LFAWLISHQPAVLFSHNKPATSNQTAVLFSQNKPAPAIRHQPTEQAARALEIVGALVARGAQLSARNIAKSIETRLVPSSLANVERNSIFYFMVGPTINIGIRKLTLKCFF
jgi:hypothetical protein